MAFLSLILILNNFKSTSEKVVFIVDSNIGQEISNSVSLPSCMQEGECPVVDEPILNAFQTSLQSPAVGNFLRVSPVEELLGQVDEIL